MLVRRRDQVGVDGGEDDELADEADDEACPEINSLLAQTEHLKSESAIKQRIKARSRLNKIQNKARRIATITRAALNETYFASDAQKHENQGDARVHEACVQRFVRVLADAVSEDHDGGHHYQCEQ